VLVEQLELQGAEEALGDAVVEAVTGRAHGAQKAGAAEAAAERPGCVLTRRAVIGVRDDLALGRLASPDRHLNSVDDEL
jgi:hypothetical protein